jgi:hypothetical protein
MVFVQEKEGRYLFDGQYGRAMYELLQWNLTPLSVKQEMEHRIEISRLEDSRVHNEYYTSLEGWQKESDAWGQWRTTGDGIIRNPDGSVSIRVHSSSLSAVRPGRPLVNGGIGHSDRDYALMSHLGEEISAADVARYFNRPLLPHEIQDHPGWIALAQGDKSLVREYCSALSHFRRRAAYRGEWEYIPAAMGLWVQEPMPGVHVERAVMMCHQNDLTVVRGGAQSIPLEREIHLVGVKRA